MTLDAAIEAASNAAPPTPPAGLGTTRNSAAFVTSNGSNSHSVTVGAGGTWSDVLLLQQQSGNNITMAQLLAANNVTNPNQMAAGTVAMIPVLQSNGSTTYHYSSGASVNVNAANGEYHMIVPDGQGNTTTYSKESNGAGGFVIGETRINGAGVETYNFHGVQTSSGDILPISSFTLVEGGTQSTSFTNDGTHTTGSVVTTVTGTTTKVETNIVAGDQTVLVSSSTTTPLAGTSLLQTATTGYNNGVATGTDYQVKSASGAVLASGDNPPVVHSNGTFSMAGDDGSSAFYNASSGSLIYAQSAGGSGYVVDTHGKTIFFGAGSNISITGGHVGSVINNQANGGQIKLNFSAGGVHTGETVPVSVSSPRPKQTMRVGCRERSAAKRNAESRHLTLIGLRLRTNRLGMPAASPLGAWLAGQDALDAANDVAYKKAA